MLVTCIKLLLFVGEQIDGNVFFKILMFIIITLIYFWLFLLFHHVGACWEFWKINWRLIFVFLQFYFTLKYQIIELQNGFLSDRNEILQFFLFLTLKTPKHRSLRFKSLINRMAVTAVSPLHSSRLQLSLRTVSRNLNKELFELGV